MKKTIFFSFFVFTLTIVSTNIFAGDELRAANWTFGYNGWLDFSTGVPVSKSGSALSSNESCMCISDTRGELLFYSNGVTAYNREHKVMENGTGLYGNLTAAQSGMIIPAPGDNPEIYYLITFDAISYINSNSINWDHKGMNYSVIDISKNNGLGKVIEKNIRMSDKVCEKISAVRHQNGEDIWLMNQVWDEDIIEIFLIDENGVSKNPVRNTTHFMPNYKKPVLSKGVAKFSPKGDKLALAVNGVGVCLFDFDNSTGKISNEMLWTSKRTNNVQGIAFSPSGRYLYSLSGATSNSLPSQDASYLLQFDLQAGDKYDIENSVEEIVRETNTSYFFRYSLQVALDRKIYFYNLSNQSNIISSINYPEKKGLACDYEKATFTLKYGTCTGHLPVFMQSYFYRPEADVIADDCEGGVIKLISSVEIGYSYRWEGPNAFSVNQANYTIDPATRHHSGRYTLYVTNISSREETKFEFDVEIKYVDIDITLNEVPATDENTKSINYYFTIKNNSPFPVTVKSVRLKDGSRCFLNSVSTPFVIDANSSSTNDVSCYLYAEIGGMFDDELIIEISEPCEASESFDFDYQIGKLDPIIIYVHLPDTIAYVNETLRLPLQARVTELPPEGTKFDLKITWHYLADVYYTFPSQSFKMDPLYIDTLFNDSEYVTGYFDNVELDTIYRTIAYVNGYALLDSVYYTPLDFDDDEEHSSVDVYGNIIVGENGSITTQAPACLSRDIVMNPYIYHYLTVQPTPLDQDGTIKLYSSDRGDLTLDIYSLTGELMENHTFYNTDVFTRDLPIDISKYPSGTYFLVWRSNRSTYRKTIIVTE